MEIRVNGKIKDLAQPTSVASLLADLKIPADSLVVELNQNILQAGDYATTLLQEGDRLELIQFVGGG